MRYGWSLEKSEWLNLFPYIVNNQLWRAVQLTIGERDGVPTGSGVYVMCVAPPNRKLDKALQSHNPFEFLYTPIYIGQTDNLKRRFLEHCQRPKPELQKGQDCFNGNIHYWFIRIEPQNLDKVEADLIACFGPPANVLRGIRARIGTPVPA
jgi:hypothetical protein